MTSRRSMAHAMPTAARLPRANAPERYYVGRRPERTDVLVVSRTELEPLAHLSYRGDAAFDWARVTEGALELAFALLVHSTESRPPDLVCRAFCREVVACLDPAGFVLSHGDIALWLMTALCDPDPSPHGLGPERSGWVAGHSTGFARGGGAHDYQAERLGWIPLPARAATLTRELDRRDAGGRRPVRARDRE